MIKNQKVVTKVVSSGALQVTSLQDVSTPGVYQRYTLTPNCEYKISLIGAKCTNARGTVHLWIGDVVKETIYLSKDSLKQGVVTTMTFSFYNNTRTLLHVGALFDKVVIGDQFQVFKLTVTKTREGVTNSRGDPPKLNSKEQRETHKALEKVYDNCWTEILLRMERSTAKTLEDIWYQILEYEYEKTVRDYLYYDRKAIAYEDEDDFYRAVAYSRKPVLDGIATFAPEAVIECGAGWGKNLYYLFMKGVSTEIDYYGLELTEQGIKAMKTMSNYTPEYNLYINQFDFDNPEFDLSHDYESILLFTMWSIKEITYLNKMFFYTLLDKAERVMGVHLEPIGWQLTGHGKPYSYFNRNFYSLLKELESEGRIKITKQWPDMIGIFSQANAASLVVWEKI